MQHLSIAQSSQILHNVTLIDSEIMGFPIQIGWGKAVPLPPNPIYVPPNKEDAMQPDPPSGLPFNAQLKKGMKESQIDKNNVEKVYLTPPLPLHPYHSLLFIRFSTVLQLK